MQPEHQQPPASAQQPVAGWPPASGHWGGPPPAAGAAGPVADQRSGRPGLVILVALLVEIIVIAAADNQWVAEKVSNAALNHPDTLGYDFALALLTYQWRFSPAAGDRLHSLYGQWALLGVLLVLTAALVALAARGRAGFARVFFGTWTAVLAATVVGAIVRGAIVDGRLLQGRSRFQFALFSDIGPSQYVVVGGLGLGLLVGLAAGFTAVAARREAEHAPAVAAAPVPEQRRADPRADARTTAFERPPADATQQFDRGRSDPEATQQIPRDQADPIDQFRGQRDAPAEPEQTRELPRVDEEHRDG